MSLVNLWLQETQWWKVSKYINYNIKYRTLNVPIQKVNDKGRSFYIIKETDAVYKFNI